MPMWEFERNDDARRIDPSDSLVRALVDFIEREPTA